MRSITSIWMTFGFSHHSQFIIGMVMVMIMGFFFWFVFFLFHLLSHEININESISYKYTDFNWKTESEVCSFISTILFWHIHFDTWICRVKCYLMLACMLVVECAHPSEAVTSFFIWFEYLMTHLFCSDFHSIRSGNHH